MSDHVTFHTATSATGGSLEEAKQALAAAEATLASIGKKGLLERQSTHDKKVADAQAAVDAARARVTSLSGGQSTEHKATDSATGSASASASTGSAATGSSASNASVEAAAERIRKLKAENAPQIEVRAAVEAHALEQANALKAAGAPQAEVKAAVLNYIALTEDPLVLTPVEVAKKKVRMLKANEAPQEEVKAAVEAYTALLASESKGQASTGHGTSTGTSTTGHAASTQGQSTSRQADSTGSQSSSVEAAAEKVRALKAAKAPQAEVKAAVEAYIALTEGGQHKNESKGGAVVSSQTPVEAAAEKVRQLKAARAPQAEVKAAVEAYIALTGAHGSSASQASSTARGTSTQSSTQTTGTQQGSSNLEHKASGDLEAAAERVRSLKAAKAPQAEVKAAVEAYVIEEAKDKVNRLKASRAPQAEVKAAVEAYVALTEGQSRTQSTTGAAHTASGTHTHGTHHTGEHTSGHTGTHHTGDHTSGAHHTGHDATTGAHQTGHGSTTAQSASSDASSEDAPAVRVHLGQ